MNISDPILQKVKDFYAQAGFGYYYKDWKSVQDFYKKMNMTMDEKHIDMIATIYYHLKVSPMEPTKEQYDIAKAIVEAYEAKTGEKVKSITVSWDDHVNAYLQGPSPFPDLDLPLTDEEKEQMKKHFNDPRYRNGGKC